MTRSLPASLLLASLLISCTTALQDNTPYVNTPRILAVQLVPAESLTGEEVRIQALYADSGGARQDAEIDWAFCTALKPLAELGPVAQSCLDPASTDLSAIGTGVEATGVVPDNACSLYGPNPPPVDAGGSAGRPTDPDITGGYYQPILAFDDEGETTLASVRLRCGPANVDQETFLTWSRAYHSNENPIVSSFQIDGQEVAPEGAGASLTVAPGQELTLTALWPACPIEPSCGDGLCTAGEDELSCEDDCAIPTGCGGSEAYQVFDPTTGEFTLRQEAISASWFTTGGTFAEARNGRDGTDTEPSVENSWTAPDEPEDVWMAVVLRDERGGVGFSSYRLVVSD